MEEIVINTQEWIAPEYTHKEKTIDWFWTIGLITLVIFIVVIWFGNYVFSIFILMSGLLLIMFSIRHPKEITFKVSSEGISAGRELYEFKNIKGFDTKKGSPFGVLLLQTNKYFLPIHTIPIPNKLIPEVKESLQKVIPLVPLEESKSMVFSEKLGL